MVAELRKSGNRIVLYTDDVFLYKYIDNHTIPKYQIKYLQNGKMVGIDLYFDKGLKNTVKRIKHGQMLLGI